ncbi:MAG: hypothetical protein JW947_10525 [Sedimentisphaerales bacterium]|nr:hypothetical protein [Sedimentisphaerales bacterium]
MKALIIIPAVLSLSILTGCSPENGSIKTANSNKDTELLTVDFNDSQPLRYKFVCSRDIIINWEPSKTSPGGEPTAQEKFSESLETIVAYTPVEIKPFGLSTIEAKCESAKVRRSRGTKQDAAESFAGKTYRLKVSPAGKIEDHTELEKLIKETGEKAFRPDTGRGRIKEPDMIGDFIASQWFLWDSVSSIENASKGVSLKQSWQSKLSVPTPMVTRLARDVTYTLEDFREGEKGRLAVISSVYSPAETTPQSWPIPYTGRFQASGTFGFLGNYKLLELSGNGEELFNIPLGRTERGSQQYKLKLQASIPLGIGDNPEITITQNITTELLEN